MLRPAQPQRWDAVEGFRPSFADTRHLAELRLWSLIAIGALALAGVFALFLVLGRVLSSDSAPPWLLAYFDKFLVVHVVFSFVVWFLAQAAVFMQVAALRFSNGQPHQAHLGRAGAWAMLTAFALLAVAAVLDRGAPSLNNYIPAILDPIFYIGLLAIAFSAAATAVRTLINAAMRQGPLEPVGATGLAAAVIALAAIAAFAVSWNRMGGMPTTPAGNEDLFWAGGHILQFLNVAVMIGTWAVLGGRAFGRPAVQPKVVIGALSLAAALALAGFGLLFVAEPFSAEERYLFTQYQYALAPAPLIVGALAAVTLFREAPANGAPARAARLTLAVSLVVFFSGALLGIFVDGSDTRTPAHYHGVIGGVNVALMGFIYVFVLPLLERGLVRWRWARASIWLYGLGQLLHSVGLFVAGGYGAPRKVAGTAPGLDVVGNWLGHAGIGIGGIIAVIGGVSFIVISAKRLLAKNG